MGKFGEGIFEGIVLGVLIKTGIDISPLGIGGNIMNVVKSKIAFPDWLGSFLQVSLFIMLMLSLYKFREDMRSKMFLLGCFIALLAIIFI